MRVIHAPAFAKTRQDKTRQDKTKTLNSTVHVTEHTTAYIHYRQDIKWHLFILPVRIEWLQPIPFQEALVVAVVPI
jgi:hypothetical protein